MQIDEFEHAISEDREEPIQKFLADNDEILIRTFFSTGTFFCVPKFRFGNEFISDFLLVKLWSTITDIVLIELEPPTARPFNLDGSYSKRLNGAIQQITNWTSWVYENRQYFYDSIIRKAKAVNPSYSDTLTHRIKYDLIYTKIIIGRRDMMRNDDNARRAGLFIQARGSIEILPYDRLLDVAKSIWH